MQYSRVFLILFFGIFSFAAVAQEKPVITIAADNWCPINCTRPETRLGVGIDLAKAIFEPLGYTIDYQVMSWSEAIGKVRTGQVSAVIGASKFDDPTLIFPQKPVYKITDDFYVLKGNSWRFQGVHTLKGKKLGVIEDYGYGKTINDYVANNQGRSDLIQKASGELALRDNIKKLQNREIDVLVETRPVMEYTIAKMNLDNIIWAGGAPQASIYLAFSPALPGSRTLAAQFDAGMQRLSNAGTLEGFYAAYGLSLTER